MMIGHASHARQSPPTVHGPEAGLALLPFDRLSKLRTRYEELLGSLGAYSSAAYLRGVIRQIDALLEPHRER